MIGGSIAETGFGDREVGQLAPEEMAGEVARLFLSVECYHVLSWRPGSSVPRVRKSLTDGRHC